MGKDTIQNEAVKSFTKIKNEKKKKVKKCCTIEYLKRLKILKEFC